MVIAFDCGTERMATRSVARRRCKMYRASRRAGTRRAEAHATLAPEEAAAGGGAGVRYAGSLTPVLTLPQAAVAFGAAFLAGAINSVAGGGTLVSFPALIWLGLNSVAANATNTVAIWPGRWAARGATGARPGGCRGGCG